ncbi:metal ABC transporter substrate-binding protein [Microlunatus soli]|uniref:Zinc transport system substrate-binding protein n=1 Tax=Microlunatus soli TaxID=630515 RepID=A0A1H1YUN5_9ACTN|nr:metal ABC transporter substrate-binding protein [Microlunatus soli]SDT25154.1 zinc transport system substrate-binding protein [Microlunatus soli]
MTVFPRALGALLSMSALLLVTACGATGGAKADGSQSGQLTIVAGFYPLQYVAERVAGTHASVQSLTKPGAEPHDLELTPKQVASVSTADLVLYEKHFQAAVDDAVAQSGNDHVLDTATVVPLEDHGPLGEEEHEHGDEHSEGTTNLDPHVWLDPNNMIKISDAVTAALTKQDPDNAADYTKNAAALTDDLKGLDSAYRSGLKSCQRTEFVTSHAAFGYLAERYDLTQVPINGLSPDSEPSPARIAAVQQEITKHKVTTIFYETLVSPAVAKSIAGDLKLKTDVLDPIEGITDQSKGKDYVAVMKSNLTALQKANGCS